MTKEEVIEILERFVLGAKPCSQREIVDACASAYRMLKEQPSLPSNLDEAAIQAHIRLEDGEGLSFLNIFKAGAEWMAGQGITVTGDTDDEYVSILEDVEKAICKIAPDSTVNIQIRK